MPLNDDELDKWIYKKHTEIKHEILSKYLGTWIRILGSRYKAVNYFDCFAGRGEYAEGEKGSPIIALDTAKIVKEDFSYLDKINCYFVEKNKNNYENLVKKIADNMEEHKDDYEGMISTQIINDEFINIAPDFTQISSSTPSFFFIDPFGWSGIPFKAIKDILKVKRTEVFLNFMVRDMNRFLTNSNHKISIDDFFGIENVEEIIKNRDSEWAGEYALLELYKKQLLEDAKVNYVLSYKVCADETSQTTYYLIHATNHPMGCEVMKNIMYKAGTEGRFGYLGPQNGQMNLMRYSDSSEFQNYLFEKFGGRKLSYQQIRYETLTETKFIQKDYKEALLELERKGKVIITGKGTRGGFKDKKAIINFICSS
ncbi:hypothetical protein MSMTP_0106 [Methanosarcina sp. MTP4]|uniref:three-Cys-motif partner protein TcmP n=1 Tax=Methanosarcina sp. MTP4 TaxID=1434100 RepID=UPI000615918B|nr:three-Cys-motif partner protein TcmP [Methanosarcina sp. MTP4]AKB23575.1 hypothetical protein MSMTP_0106 [Methanosarcina sp. MTP4]